MDGSVDGLMGGWAEGSREVLLVYVGFVCLRS
jgi:hypothetical protein